MPLENSMFNAQKLINIDLEMKALTTNGNFGCC